MQYLNLKKILFASLFPEFCLGCRKQGTLCCYDCLAKIEINQMAIPFESNLKYLDKVFSATSYQNFLVKKMIQNFKYPPYLKSLAQPLAYLILSHFLLTENSIIKQTGENFIIVPVPLWQRKEKKRGFNQSALIAGQLSQAINIPLTINNLVKIKKTKPQMELDRTKREKNIRNCFAIKNPSLIQAKKILLIDDILTTGATLNGCARVLKQARADQVYGITIAFQPLQK